jgi:hypothetical protein
MAGPENTAILEVRRPVFTPMIRLREHFQLEMRETLNQVQ